MLGDRRRLQKSFMKVSLWSGCLSLYWQTGKSFASLRPLVTPWCSFLVSSGSLFALASTFSFKISQLLFRVLWAQPPSGGGELEHPSCLLHASTHTPPISTRKRGEAPNHTRWWIHIGVSVLSNTVNRQGFGGTHPRPLMVRNIFFERHYNVQLSQFSHSSCLTLCDPMDCSTPGLLVHHQLPELTQTNAHWVTDAIQTFHALSSPFSSHLQSFPASGSFSMS